MKVPASSITRINVSWSRGSGIIAGLAFFETFEGNEIESLVWRQWAKAKITPPDVYTSTQWPPQGNDWRFVGLMGDFDVHGWGNLLSRISGIWTAT